MTSDQPRRALLDAAPVDKQVDKQKAAARLGHLVDHLSRFRAPLG